MFKLTSQKFSGKTSTFVLIFSVITLLLGLGFFIGWQAENMTVIHTETVPDQVIKNVQSDPPLHKDLSLIEVLVSDAYKFTFSIGMIIALLIFWTILLFIKSGQNQRALKKIQKLLEREISRNLDTTSELDITHQQLTNTTGQLDGILQGTIDFIAAIDRDFRFISFNDSFRDNIEKLFGVRMKIGMRVDEVLASYPDKIKRSKQLWQRALDGEKFTADQIFAADLHNTHYYEISYTPICNNTGEIIGASQICRDITEKTLIAENLKRERDFASAVFDFNSSIILVLDSDGRIIRLNQTCEKILGYQEKEVRGRVFWNILLPTEEINPVKTIFLNFDSSSSPTEYVHRWITKDEHTRHFSWSISAIRGEEDINELVVLTGIDITEKSDSENARIRMLEILENSTDLIRISDIHGQITYLNQAGRKMLGLGAKSDISQLKISGCHPDWVNEILISTGIPTAVKSGSWLGETAVKTIDNKEIPTSQLILSHKNKFGEIECYSSVLRDISDQKKLEQKYADACATAVEISRSKSNFIASMSHEIRTPMNGIIGFAELLQNTDLNDVQRDYANIIGKSGDTLLMIINDILDFSKLEASKLKFDRIDFDLNEILESLLELFAKTLCQKNIELCLFVHPNVPRILRGDPGRLRQILTNLINNAIKYTEEGDIFIEVKLDDADESSLHFSVKDTGIGIHPDLLDKLFEPFTQADLKSSGQLEGTGLGLAISRQLVNLMDGQIGVTSKPGKGSTFWFTAQFETQSRINESLPMIPNLKNVRILIAARNKRLRHTLLSQTKSMGMRPDEANSGETALNLLIASADQGEPFDIVVLDMALEEMNDLQLAHQIKSRTRLRHTQVLLLPSIHNRQLIETTQDPSLKLFSLKPVKPTAFQKLLGQMVSKNKAGQSLQVQPNLEIDNPSSDSPENNTYRILIAEDNTVNQKVTQKQVLSLGYEADLVENGQQVIDALIKNDYSLILMDCQMPVMDGFETTRKIREIERKKGGHIPIIAVTAQAIEGDQEKCLAAGMDDYVSKPTKKTILGKTISFWLNRSIPDDQFLSSTDSKSFEFSFASPLAEAEHINSRLAILGEDCGEEVVLECLDLFLEDSSGLIEELLLNLEEPDFEKLVDATHKLKGSSSNMGAIRLPKLCQKLLQLARSQKTRDCRILIKQIDEEYQSLNIIYSTIRSSFRDKISSEQYIT